MTHWFERVHIRPLRKVALKKAEKWMLEHFERRMVWARFIRPC